MCQARILNSEFHGHRAFCSDRTDEARFVRHILPASSYLIDNADSERVESIVDELRQLEVVCSPARDPSVAEGYLLVFFAKVSDSLLEIVETLKSRRVFCLCVAMGEGTIPSADVWRLLQAGASDEVIASNVTAGQIFARLERWHIVDSLLESEEVAGQLIGSSPAWKRLLRQVVEIACFTIAPVLFAGETGTGKDLLARMIHALDSRPKKSSLITLDCTTIVPELSGSELFGHERGAFTGAVSGREGAFALAHNGTLFLDEVGELPLVLQAQFLRAVQERTYKKVGGNTWHQTDFRLICATNRDLEAEVRRGSFRSDLYYRLASWVFHPPPLRDRREDILSLARYFLASSLPARAEAEFDPAVAEYLETREYSGNVRELRQLVTRMGQRHVGPGPITAGDLPADEWPLVERSAHNSWPDELFEASIRKGLANGAELRKISKAASDVAIKLTVQSEHGNLQRAAKRLGITDRALQLRKASGQI
jgi:transcriptional regulator with GAF, ATPase, and Fis domain